MAWGHLGEDYCGGQSQLQEREGLGEEGHCQGVEVGHLEALLIPVLLLGEMWALGSEKMK